MSGGKNGAFADLGNPAAGFKGSKPFFECKFLLSSDILIADAICCFCFSIPLRLDGISS